MSTDPYAHDRSLIEEPPLQFGRMLKYLGPGFILSASIVGSGELIATTALGAEAGFVAMWVIIVSCLVKVFVQLEFGKHAIHSGETTFEALNQLPGPKFGKGSWATWLWLVMMLIKPLQVGGIIGGVGLILNLLVPSVSIGIWVCLSALTAALMIFRGRYQFIEKLSLLMIGLFAIFTLACVIGVQYTEFAMTRAQIIEGLSFWNGIPIAVIGVAIAAFGITGVGGDEVMAYNYWLLEKGYAARTGPREETPAWNHRAKGWIKVMYWDAFLSMLVYTFMTVAFYMLGAAILHAQGLKPEGFDTVKTLSRMYTDSLGSWAEIAFLIGAFFVLFSTLFSALAAWSRLFSDAFSSVGWMDYHNPVSRGRMIAILSFFFPALWAVLFFVFKDPVWMVLAGGAITAAILLLVVAGSVHFRYRRLPASLRPSAAYDIGFWINVISIVLLAILAVWKAIE
ncbi:MAG TPA: Nramp family divalent metal transporter, partial [Verrucomicrobiales bacterium]|nr:Nramp family divalent metal transporter [Verrucomicrobiales bacterium]